MQLGANALAARTPCHDAAGCGFFQRSAPVGGAANGIPLHFAARDLRGRHLRGGRDAQRHESGRDACAIQSMLHDGIPAFESAHYSPFCRRATMLAGIGRPPARTIAADRRWRRCRQTMLPLLQRLLEEAGRPPRGSRPRRSISVLDEKDERTSTPPGPAKPSAPEVQAQLERILASWCFEQAGRASRFLRYAVEQTLA